MKTLIFQVLMMFLTSCAGPTIRVVHYNIKELSTPKIDQHDFQLKQVKVILDEHPFDVLSLNEIQFDQEGVPRGRYQSRGKNIQKLANAFGVSEYNTVFHPANTGEKARKKSDGSYYENPNDPKAREYADQINFGIFPHQYSTGALLSYKVISEVVIKDLKWKEFNPKASIHKFRDGKGKKLPEDMALFDKNFTDIVADVEGREVHFVFLHAVPAYHFGNQKSPNYERNADQLRFLEWYLTGETDFEVELPSLKPLGNKKTFIAMGDFNTSIKDTNNPGSAVLNRLFTKTQTWIPKDQMTFTNEGSSYSPKPFRLLLDYIISSKDLKITASGIVHPNWKIRDELGCNGMPKLLPPEGKALVSYHPKKGEECWVLVDRQYQILKEASDHYPIWAHFEFKK